MRGVTYVSINCPYYKRYFPALLWHQCFVGDVPVKFSFCYYRGCHLVVTVSYILSLICACILEFVFNEYSNLHQAEFKSKMKCRKLHSNAREVLLIRQ
jgi:hypothetical protein